MRIPESEPSRGDILGFRVMLIVLCSLFMVIVLDEPMFSKYTLASIVGVLFLSFHNKFTVSLFKLWMFVVRGIGKVLGPLELGLVYFFILTPFSYIVRAARLSRIRQQENKDSNWETNLDEVNLEYFRRSY